jgi:pimeloyl-ACP methyl ester carboxylesterase
LEPRPDPAAGLLLVDYPGYGLCQGNPSAAAIQESARASLEALARRLGCHPADLVSRLHILGHSMGTGPAVNLAQAVRPQRLVLISPWTSFREVGRHRYGPFSGAIAAWVVGEEYDNRAGLRQLGQTANPPPLTVVHGAEDTVTPAWMGRELVDTYAGPAEYRELPGRGHDGIVATVLPVLLAPP